MGKFFITPNQLWAAMGGAEAPLIIDTRRHQAFEEDSTRLPGAIWAAHTAIADAIDDLPHASGVIVYCVHGHNVSNLAAASLREKGIDARLLRGGIGAWAKAGHPLVNRATLPDKIPDGGGSIWVTRRRPKIDRIACPWLIRRFIDPLARFLYVEPDHVLEVAEETGGISYDIEDADITHDGEKCSFDVLLARSGLNDPALDDLARIIRAADTDTLDQAPEAAGLLAVSVGISALAGEDDHAALERGFAVYDALYAWRRKAPDESHNWPGGPAK